tara:strand:- start:6163 stop:8364 length:2202 start_codon:yes stop_codon:yes gene_type:complete
MFKLGFLLIITIGFSLIPFSFSDDIPEWVKNNASWWSDRIISQNEFTNGLEFLINEGIIYVPVTEPGPPGPDKIIPDWVRNTAGWWSDNLIPDSEFVNAMKYLIEIGLIEVNASSPEIIEEEIIEELSEDSTVLGKPLYMSLEGYRHAAADGKFVLDVKIFDADKCSPCSFGLDSDYTINGVNVDIKLFNEERELIHTLSETTKGNGIVRYDVMAKETSQKRGLWLINNLYSVNIIASLDGQTVEKNYEFLGQESAYAYNSGSADRGPTNLSATAGNDLVKLSWSSPPGVKGISDYTIQYSTDQINWTTFTEASVTDIRATDSITDDGTLLLNGAAGVDVYTVGTSTYAIVASTDDKGVQILDITNPTDIVAKGSLVDNGDRLLNGAKGVKVFRVSGDSNTYAIVATTTEKGVQVLNITDPDAITATDSLADGGSRELNGAMAVDIFSIGGSMYAIVAAQSDSGVQIINITNPSDISATDQETDNANSFTRLGGPRGIATFTVSGDSNTYAIVTSYSENGIQMINITEPDDISATDNEVDGTNDFDTIANAFGVDTFTVGTNVYAIVTSNADDAIQIINVTDPTDISATDSQVDGAESFTELQGARDVSTFTIGSNVYAAVISEDDDGITIVNVTEPTDVRFQDEQDDGDTELLDELNAPRDITTFEMNSQVYAIIASDVDDGIQIVSLDGVGYTPYVVVDGLDDSTFYYFRVAGENYSGLGEYSAVVTATTT